MLRMLILIATLPLNMSPSAVSDRAEMDLIVESIPI